MVHILQLPLRVTQIAFCAIVLGLSASLSKGQYYGHAPAVTNFNAFNGAFGLLVAFIGIVAAFMESLPGFAMAAIDALASIFFIAGSVAYAVKLGVHSCSPGGDKDLDLPKSANPYTASNSIINAGVQYRSDGGYITDDRNYEGRCRMAQADDAFLFLALACFLGSLILDLISGGRGGRTARSNV